MAFCIEYTQYFHCTNEQYQRLLQNKDLFVGTELDFIANVEHYMDSECITTDYAMRVSSKKYSALSHILRYCKVLGIYVDPDYIVCRYR